MNKAEAAEFHKTFYGCKTIDIDKVEFIELLTEECIVASVEYEFSVEIKLKKEVKEYLKKCIKYFEDSKENVYG